MFKTKGKVWFYTTVGFIIMLSLMLWSLNVGTAKVTIFSFLRGEVDADGIQILLQSRFPRTFAIVLSGSALAIAGLVMQMLVQNRYVEPATTGVTEAAGLGILLATLLLPSAPIIAKMGIAIIFALLGTFLLIYLIHRIPHRNIVVVPLLGIVLSGIIGAGTMFLAWEFQLQGTLSAWQLGDFSGVIAGRYEPLWIVLGVGVIAYIYADRFTVAGLGTDISTSLGLDHKKVNAIGLVIVAVVAGICTVIAGSLPFLGLVVPNLVSLLIGDYMRQALPLVAIGGAIFVLAADTIGRLLIAPAEIPVGVVMGVVGALIFLIFLLKRN